jgi:UPF0735 ACT domain-containing protein SH1278
MDNEKVYYIIREDVLPEAVKKTIIMKKALEENPKLSILEASKRFDLSRSAFYKYKDTIFPIQEIQRQSILSLSIDVDDIPGILGRVLSVVNEEKCSVLTIHQTVPINSRATIIISLEIDPGHTNIEKLTKRIQNLEFVNKIKVIGVSM